MVALSMRLQKDRSPDTVPDDTVFTDVENDLNDTACWSLADIREPFGHVVNQAVATR
jgi:hypothetical protein